MALLELSMVTGAIAEMGVEAVAKKLGRREAVLKTLKRLKLDTEAPSDDFDAIYAHTLVEYGIFKPNSILNFFRNEFIQKAFRQAFYENNLSILNREAEGIIQWNQETAQLGYIDYDPRREFASFTAVFHQIVDNSRTPAEVKRDQKLEDIHQQVATILEEMNQLNALDDIRAELVRISQSTQLRPGVEGGKSASPQGITSSTPHQDTIRWLHLSDFHTGKDGYGQSRLFKYILDHVRSRVENGLGPDLVFISGDIANKGKLSQYEEFYENFFLPLIECLSGSQDRIFIIPGNHDVDRSQVRAVQPYDVLLRVPEFLDPTEQGQFERRVIFPRFQAYAENDMTGSGEHWLFSNEGTTRQILSIRETTIGVLGINTAWFSYGDQDRHKLSAGKALLEDGLESLQECDIKIVLGHHPIDWFLDTDLDPVRSLLGRHNVIYLHGHMHKGRVRHEEGAGYPFLALQSGACFQAREDDIWVNRFLWCELDLSARSIRVEPLQWSRDHHEWVLDGTAFPDRYRQGDRWVLPLPLPAQTQPSPIITPLPEIKSLKFPSGWVLVDAQYLKDRTVELSNEQALGYFDGRPPIWREALASQIPRREIVHKLVDDLEDARRTGQLRVTLLIGAAGEGKTTVLLQTVCDLIKNSADWHILWCYDSSAPLPAEFIARLPQDGTWLVVSDDAEVIARRVFEAAQALNLRERRNVQFFLCCRDTDWKAVGADALAWKKYVTFVEVSLRGLSSTDAKGVVTAWSKYGKEGLKKLEGLELQEASLRFIEAAKSEHMSYYEGTFFGAVLQVRWGEGLKDHIYDLLSKLEKRSIGGGKTLRDAFAYIAAMHAEELQILSKEVLAEVLEINLSDLKRAVLGPLGEEAAIATTGRFVFTRHRAIADVTLQILSDTYNIDVENIYVELIQSAARSAVAGNYIPNRRDWKFLLSSHFFSKGNHALAIRLAQAVLKVEPDDSYLIVKLSQLYREAGQPEQGVRVLHSASENVRRHRGYYYEWGTAEGVLGYEALGVWLRAYSLSDEASRQPIDNDQAKVSLNGLSIAFAELYDRFNSQAFIEAGGAAAQLGLSLKLDTSTRNWLNHNRNRAKEAGVGDVPHGVAFERLRAGIIRAWEHREDELPQWIPPGDALNFRGLARLLGVSG